MTVTKIALYRASLLSDNLGIRLCLAAAMVMPSALVFLFPLLGLFGDLDVAPATGGVAPEGTWTSTLVSLALCIGFAGAWTRIAFLGARLVRRPGQRLFVLSALAIGTATLAVVLLLRLTLQTPDDDAGWLLLAAFFVHAFLLAGTLGQARPDRLNRI